MKNPFIIPFLNASSVFPHHCFTLPDLTDQLPVVWPQNLWAQSSASITFIFHILYDDINVLPILNLSVYHIFSILHCVIASALLFGWMSTMLFDTHLSDSNFSITIKQSKVFNIVKVYISLYLQLCCNGFFCRNCIATRNECISTKRTNKNLLLISIFQKDLQWRRNVSPCYMLRKLERSIL